MADTSENIQEIYEFKATGQAIQKIFNNDTSDILFQLTADESDQKQQQMEIYAHKTLLSALSPVFEAMFSGNWKESTSVQITDASFDAFNAFIQYFYADKVAINMGNVAGILYLADKYDIPKLVSACSSFLLKYVTFEVAVDFIGLACAFGFDKLKMLCKEIVSKNTVQVVECESFRQCHIEALFEILSIPSSTCSEEKMFDACIEWAQNKCKEQNIDTENAKNVRNMLGSCFERIKFNKMPMVELIKRMKLHKNMFTEDEIVDMIDIHAKIECNTRYGSIAVLLDEWMGPRGKNECYSCIRFNVSKKIRLKSLCAPNQARNDVSAGANANRSEIVKIDVFTMSNEFYRSTKHEFRRKIIRGIEYFELETARALSAGYFYRINIDLVNQYPLFVVAKEQTVQGITLNMYSPNVNSLTYFSALNFEK